ncbi:MAG: TIM barrel protein [Chloroflexota bacterium]|nr:TIM barrel protein [Chloroflexota bacterium]
MRFSANISTLFKEVPFLDRFARAAAAGFRAVEFWWPAEDLDEVEAAVRESGLQVALFNFNAGNMAAGERGLAGNPDPNAQQKFRENVPVALDLARRLSCPKLNLLVGLHVDGVGHEQQLLLARDNVAWTADKAADAGMTVVIEALNTIESPGYLLDTTRDAAAFVERVGRPNVRLQYDAYHMQRMEGNLTANLRTYMPLIGHIQIADSPDRGQPGTGEINYPYVLRAIDGLGYNGYVGLEYNPTTPATEESLHWLPRELRGTDVDVAQLRL